MKVLKIKRINDKARLPQYAHPGDAGLNSYYVENIEINPEDTASVRTGIIIELPEETKVQVRPPSGLALKPNLTKAYIS